MARGAILLLVVLVSVLLATAVMETGRRTAVAAAKSRHVLWGCVGVVVVGKQTCVCMYHRKKKSFFENASSDRDDTI